MKICFLGIGGVSMAKLAVHLKSLGFYVYGQDRRESVITTELKRLGISIFIGENLETVKGADIVVYTSAIEENSFELNLARLLKIPILKRAELLGIILKKFNRSIGVSGSHGKTTVTKMISKALTLSKIDTFEHAGAFEGNFNCGITKKTDIAVAEVCEYKKNISYIKVKTAIVLNIDNDHLDCYGKIELLLNEFLNYLNRSEIKIINLDDYYLREHILKTIDKNNLYTYGIENCADYTAKNICCDLGMYSFEVFKNKTHYLNLKLRVAGKHEIYNALAAIAALDLNGLSPSEIKTGVENYSGVVRRFENLGELCGVPIIADYAHHPTEINATLKTMSEVYGGDFSVVFQPHTYSRTRILFDEFISALKGQNVAIYKTYPARERYDFRGDGELLAKKLNAIYVKSQSELKEFIIKSKVKALLIMGAGDIYEIVKELIT